MVKTETYLWTKLSLYLENNHFSSPSELHIHKASSFLPIYFWERGFFSGERAWEELGILSHTFFSYILIYTVGQEVFWEKRVWYLCIYALTTFIRPYLMDKDGSTWSEIAGRKKRISKRKFITTEECRLGDPSVGCWGRERWPSTVSGGCCNVVGQPSLERFLCALGETSAWERLLDSDGEFTSR